MTADLITEPTVHLCWSEHAIRRAAEVLQAANLEVMAADVIAHLPQPVIPAEPTSCNAVAFVNDSFWHLNVDDRWTATDRDEDADLDDWAALVALAQTKDGRDPVVYLPQLSKEELTKLFQKHHQSNAFEWCSCGHTPSRSSSRSAHLAGVLIGRWDS